MIGGGTGAAVHPHAARAGRPNILLITTDQHRADHLGCAGDRLLVTPHLDSLAQRGVMFERCHVASPVCMPNRAAMMTGRMPSAAGVRMNGMPLPLQARTFVDQLREAGWQTALIGKAHLQPMTARPAAWRGRADSPQSQAWGDLRDGEAYRQESVTRWSDPAHRLRLPYYGFDHAQLCLEHGDQVGGAYERWLRAQGADPARLCGRGNALPSQVPAVVDAWRTRLPEELHPTRYVALRTIEWLRDHQQGHQRGQPFFVHCSFPDPHHPFNPPGRYWDQFDPADVVLPRHCGAATPADVPLKRALHAEREASQRPAGTSRAIAVTPAEARVAIALNHGAIAFIDEAVGRLLAHLRESGLDRNTVVVFTSDHGDFMGDHGLLNKGPLHYQGLLRVPLIWADPQEPPGGRDHRLCSTLDLATTVLARCGLRPAHGLQGRDLRAPSGPGDRDAVLVEEEAHHRYPGAAFPLRVRTLVTGRWRLSVRADEPAGELYDLAEDPLEQTNLWNDPAHIGARADLTARLVQEMQRHTDDVPLPMQVA
jgi:arylsulfatase A-like enzyme